MAASVPIWVEVQPGRREEQREQAPRHPVVEIVDEASLADARQVAIAEGGVPEDARVRGAVRWYCPIRPRRAPTVSRARERQTEARRDEGDTEIEGLRPQPVAAPRCSPSQTPIAPRPRTRRTHSAPSPGHAVRDRPGRSS